MKAGPPRTGVYRRLWLSCAAAVAAGWLGLNLSSCAHIEDNSEEQYGYLDYLDSDGGSGVGGVGGSGDAETTTMSVVTSAATSTSGGVLFKCPETETDCGDTCKDLMNDPENCGACNMACQAPDTCVEGVCGCAPPTEKCSGSCINTTNDVSNCGACGNVCGAAEVCTAGVCASSCAEDETLCGEACVNVASSAQNCGACDNACMTGETCMAGSCVSATTTTGGNTNGGNTTGGNTSGGFTNGGNTTGGNTSGGGMPCTNNRPTGTDWDEATCDQWASETSECQNDWMIDNHWCDQSCGRC